MIFLLISRTQTTAIEKKIRSLVLAGIDAYAIIDDGPISGKRFITYSDDVMKTAGWTNHMSYKTLPISGWDKATYHAYHSGADYVWFCEDDIYWNTAKIIKGLYEDNRKADLIAYPLARSYNEHPSWDHWKKVELITPNKKFWISTFNQLSRVSRRVLEEMHKLSIKRKRLFFHEGMFATLCKMHGWRIDYLDDIKTQELYLHIRWNKPYTSEEVKKLIKEHGEVLIHPVKTSL
jgi:hypothetical protein